MEGGREGMDPCVCAGREGGRARNAPEEREFGNMSKTGTQRLVRIAGAKVALDLLRSGRAVKPAEAVKLKIVDEIGFARLLAGETPAE